MKLSIFALVTLSMLTTTASAESWFCTAEKSTGFAPTEGKWEQTSVTVENQKYVLRELTEEETKAFEIAPDIWDALRHEILSSEDNNALGTPDPIPSYTHVVSNHGEETPAFFCRFRPLTKRFICDGFISQSKFVFKKETGRFAASRIGGGYLKEKDDIEYADIYMTIGRCSKI